MRERRGHREDGSEGGSERYSEAELPEPEIEKETDKVRETDTHTQRKRGRVIGDKIVE